MYPYNPNPYQQQQQQQQQAAQQNTGYYNPPGYGAGGPYLPPAQPIEPPLNPYGQPQYQPVPAIEPTLGPYGQPQYQPVPASVPAPLSLTGANVVTRDPNGATYEGLVVAVHRSKSGGNIEIKDVRCLQPSTSTSGITVSNSISPGKYDSYVAMPARTPDVKTGDKVWLRDNGIMASDYGAAEPYWLKFTYGGVSEFRSSSNNASSSSRRRLR